MPTSFHLYHSPSGVIVRHGEKYFPLTGHWDEIVNRDNLFDYLLQITRTLPADPGLKNLTEGRLLPPIGSQEVWAAGVTYLRSREARMEESKLSGGASFYDLVYEAARPELFFKSLPHRVAGHGGTVHIRKDSTWNVPEPELTLFVNSQGNIQGYTIGNDMSSRSIEGENPLYLPQAKTYERSAALGPALLVTHEPISPDTVITMQIHRGENLLYNDSVAIHRMKRKHTELTSYLFRETDFPSGCYLMTGTCLVPPNDFTLQVGDQVTIEISGIGKLVNVIGIKG